MTNDLCTVLAFDPGGTTGWCSMSFKAECLTNPGKCPVFSSCIKWSIGEIDCQGTGESWPEEIGRGHDGLNMRGENAGVDKMINLVKYYGSWGDRSDNALDPWAHFPAIILEEFILDPSKANRSHDLVSPLRIISKFHYGMEQAGLDTSRFFIQSRNIKATCTDERLKNWGLYDRNSGAHARDATRHAYYFLRDCRGSGASAREKRWRAWPHLFQDPQISKRIRVKSNKLHKMEFGERI